jgi:hypothetical protein
LPHHDYYTPVPKSQKLATFHSLTVVAQKRSS